MSRSIGAAMQEPLLFFSCCYDGLHFQASKECAHADLEAIDSLLDQHLARVALLQTMVSKIRLQQHLVDDGMGNLIPWQKQRRHVKLQQRGREASFAEKLAKFGKVEMDPSTVREYCNDEL